MLPDDQQSQQPICLRQELTTLLQRSRALAVQLDVLRTEIDQLTQEFTHREVEHPPEPPAYG